MPSAAKRLLQMPVLSSIASKPLSVPTMAAAVAINSCAFMLLLLFSHVVWVLLSLRVGRSADCATDHAARSARRPPSAPATAPIRNHRRMLVEHRIDGGPRRLDRVLAREQRAVAVHRVAEQAFIWRLLIRMLLDQQQLALIADKLLAVAFHARRQRDGRRRLQT